MNSFFDEISFDTPLSDFNNPNSYFDQSLSFDFREDFGENQDHLTELSAGSLQSNIDSVMKRSVTKRRRFLDNSASFKNYLGQIATHFAKIFKNDYKNLVDYETNLKAHFSKTTKKIYEEKSNQDLFKNQSELEELVKLKIEKEIRGKIDISSRPYKIKNREALNTVLSIDSNPSRENCINQVIKNLFSFFFTDDETFEELSTSVANRKTDYREFLYKNRYKLKCIFTG